MIVRFVPFESEAQRNEAYRLWVRSMIEGFKAERQKLIKVSKHASYNRHRKGQEGREAPV